MTSFAHQIAGSRVLYSPRMSQVLPTAVRQLPMLSPGASSCAVVLNFYAPWCPWCQRLEPTWEVVAKEVHKRYPEADGRIRFGKVDCTQEVAMCREYHITGFPSIRVFRKGSDDITVLGVKEHESYRGQCFSQPTFTHPPEAPSYAGTFCS